MPLLQSSVVEFELLKAFNSRASLNKGAAVALSVMYSSQPGDAVFRLPPK